MSMKTSTKTVKVMAPRSMVQIPGWSYEDQIVKMHWMFKYTALSFVLPNILVHSYIKLEGFYQTLGNPWSLCQELGSRRVWMDHNIIVKMHNTIKHLFLYSWTSRTNLVNMETSSKIVELLGLGWGFQTQVQGWWIIW